jgi:phage tail protein X
MQPRSRRFAAAVFGMGVAVLLAAPRASGDLLPSRDSRWLDRKFVVLRAGRFDPWCEHRREIAKGDTLESIAKSAYGDAKRAKDIAAANPTLEAERLPVGAKIVLPAKEAPPRDSSETLAWEFWIYCHLSGYMPLQRVFPDESLEVEGKYPKLIAVPVARHDEFAKLIEDAKSAPPVKPGRPVYVNPEAILKAAPWALQAQHFDIDSSVTASTGAVESTTTVTVDALVSTADVPGHFIVETQDVVYRDRAGNVVKAGFDLLFSWRGIPLGLIALVGAIGLRRMRRARGGVAAS